MFIWSAFTALPDGYNAERDNVNVVAERYVVMALGALSVIGLPEQASEGAVTEGPSSARRARKARS
jgi:hypothetical protein